MTTMRDDVDLDDGVIAHYAFHLADVEGLRKATASRLRQLTRGVPDSDGVMRGFGLREGEEVVDNTAALLEELTRLEDQVAGWLAQRMRLHPLAPWIRTQKGIGEKTVARLLGAIGDPYWHPVHQRPRTVSELWAYCGMHTTPVDGVNVAPRRQRGQRANWSHEARMRTYIIADSCIVTGKRSDSAYYRLYLDARDKYTDSVHPAPCASCGEPKRPAPTGSPRSPGHLHAMGLRIVGKEVLKGLWIEARRIHEGVPHPSQVPGVLWLGG